jgi:UPF0755 protein
VIRKLLLLLGALALLAVLGLAVLQTRWETPLQIPGDGLALEVAAGESLAALAARLNEQGVLLYPRLLTWYGRWSGQDQRIKRGEYLVPPGATAESLLALLESGRVVQYQVTLPEGITLRQALDILWSEEPLMKTLSGPRDEKILSLVAPATSGEGWFFPDSYRFARGDSDWQLLERAYRAMVRLLEEEWDRRDGELPYETPYDALIMASIIEKETGLAAEREQIAGVFVRRLKRGMRLQTDPTIIYGLGAGFDGNLTREHLADPGNPYNSYRHGGLPPTPIALPGRAAIRAALHPQPGEALYFVARGDGGHVFSASLAEHEQAVRKYQLRRRRDYRSSPETN